MMMKMSNRVKLWGMILMICFVLAVGMKHTGYDEEGEEEEYYGGGDKDDEMFLLQDLKHVIKTDAGDMKVVRSGFGRGASSHKQAMHIGFITMEPKTLFIPQYIDSSLIIFIRKGEAKIGSIYKDELVERNLKIGDVYRVAAGSAFYLVNTGEGQRLHVICSIDNSESLGLAAFQSFFIGGGRNPTSVLAGFDTHTLATAFNVSSSELKDILTSQDQGPIVYVSDTGRPSIWANFLKLKQEARLQHLKKIADFDNQEEEEEDLEKPSWSWRKLLNGVFGEGSAKKNSIISRKSPDSYNLYDRRPDFKNNYGWSVALDHHDYSPLKHSGIGIYLVNLTAGSMMAPHINPTATEYGVVLRGTGSVQIVFPNGTLAMDAKVKEGDVFWVPRYFPFCQIASRTGPLEFFGFTTSSRRNRPQFLAGANSVLRTLRGEEMSAAFGVSLEEFDRVFGAQSESVILPPLEGKRGPDEKRGRDEKMRKVIGKFGHEMIMGFD